MSTEDRPTVGVPARTPRHDDDAPTERPGGPLRDRDIDRLRGALNEDTFSGRFEIVRETGSGGMGRVYEAIDRETGGRVAIKVITSPSDHARFTAEAEVLERLTHPNIVRYVRHGTTNRGEPYLAMEWLVGENLATRLARGPLSIGETVRLGELLADALHHAHREGIIHRDLKPSNIFLVDHSVEHAHLIDFGVAKLADSDLTHTGQLIGTPGYMAPEQVRGERTVDHRADLFALGCVLYESLSGRMPFEGAEVMEVLARLLLDSPPALDGLVKDVPPRLVHLVDSLLSKDREHRLGTAELAREELAAIRSALARKDDTALEQIPAHVPRASKPELARTIRDRPRWIVPAVLGALVVVGALAVIFVMRTPAAPPPATCAAERPAQCGPACDAGDGAACRLVAEALHEGTGVPVDHEAARVRDAQGCRLAHGPSCYALGTSLYGVLKDAKLPPTDPRTQRRAAEMERALRAGCEHGVWASCRRLGREYSGYGVTYLPYAPAQAFALVEKACTKLDVTACNALQDMIDDARHPAELRAAAKPLRDAACKQIACR